MSLDPLKIEVAYEQPVEVKVEFPLEILAEYRGGDNLDVTWDDYISYWIAQSLRDAGVYIKASTLDALPDMLHPKAIFSLQMTLIVQAPGFNLNLLVDNLKNENLEKGLAIWKKSKFTMNFELLYADRYAIV